MGMIKKSSAAPSAATAIPPVPSLPPSTVAQTPAPGGVSPVAKAKNSPISSDVILVTQECFEPKPKNLADFQKPWLPSESKKNNIGRIIESVLASPAYAQLVVGKRLDESLETGSKMVEHFLSLLNEKQNG